MNISIEQSKHSIIPCTLHPPLDNLSSWRYTGNRITNCEYLCDTEIQLFLNLLLEISTCKSLEDKFSDPKLKTFYVDKFLPKCIDKILTSKIVYSIRTEEVSNNCLQQMVLLLLRDPYEESSNLGKLAKRILNPKRPYYTHALWNSKMGTQIFVKVFSNLEGKNVLDLILELIKDKERSLSIKSLSNLCHIVCNINKVLPEYANIDYIDKVRDAITEKLFVDMESDTVSFTEKTIIVTLKSFILLLQKSSYPSSQERHKAMDVVRLQISKMALASYQEKSKQVGLGVIRDMLATLENPDAADVKSLSRPVCHKIIQELFSQLSKISVEFLLQQSPGLFLCLVKQNILDSSYAKSFFNALHGFYNQKIRCLGTFELRSKRIIYKIFLREHRKLLIDWIVSNAFPHGSAGANIIDAEVFKMIYEYSKYSMGSDLVPESLINFIHGMLINSQKVNCSSIFQRVLSVYIYLILSDKEKLKHEEVQYYLKLSKDGGIYFKNLFIEVNEKLNLIWREEAKKKERSDFIVKVLPEELEGFDELWKIIMEFEQEKAKEEAMDFLVSIYSSLEDNYEADMVSIRERYLDRCFGYLRSSEKVSDDECLRSLKLIEKMMDESEKYGIGELLTHDRLLKNEMLELQVALWGRKISVRSNNTVFDLLKEVGKQYGTAWKEIQLFRYPYSPQEIPKTHNGRTLAEIGIKRGEPLKFSVGHIVHTELLHDAGSLSVRARKTFMSIFEEYSDNGKMNIEQLIILTSKLNPYTYRPRCLQMSKEILLEYDLDRSGHLTFENFLAWNLKDCQERPATVWKKLYKLGKTREDLQEVSEITKKQATISSLISYIIASRSEDVKLLFSFLDKEDEIAYQAWKLLSRIPTCPKILEDILTLKGLRGLEYLHRRDWNSLLNLKTTYKLLYALNVVEYLICYDKNQVKVPFIEEDIKLKEYQHTWRRDFIDYGGLDHLEKICDLFKPKSDAISKVLCKKILKFMRTVGNELDSMGKDENVLRFKKALCEYERDYLAMEHRTAANLMKRTILKLKKKRESQDMRKVTKMK